MSCHSERPCHPDPEASGEGSEAVGLHYFFSRASPSDSSLRSEGQGILFLNLGIKIQF
jgi:hypothetical protein